MRLKWLRLLFLGYLLFSPTLVRADSVLEDIQKTGLLKVGIREDAVPFGFRDANDQLSGVCLDFINILLKDVKKTLNREAIIVKIYKSTLYNRYNLVSDRIIHIECGPNTIRELTDYNITFSRPFLITGTQFLIRAEDAKKFNPSSSLENETIGVLRNTTNKALIEERYPRSQLREFQGITGRFRGVQALQQGKITAFASDGILLIGEATLQGLLLGRTYLIVPKEPLDCERYGMILPNNDPQWLEMVNQSIVNAREGDVFRDWLGVVLPEIRATFRYCRKK